MTTETVNTDEKPLRSMPSVGEAPPMTPKCEGWWWLVWANDWCVGLLEYKDYDGGRMAIRLLSATHGMQMIQINRVALGNIRWGGRLAVPGASPTVAVSHDANVEQSYASRLIASAATGGNDQDQRQATAEKPLPGEGA